jgi:Fuc2NAc and GlcNAc transferase
MDLPDEARKLHVRPTPTSGGIGIMFGMFVGFICLVGVLWQSIRHDYTLRAVYLDDLRGEAMRPYYLCLAMALAGGVLGFIDDRRQLNAKLKLAVMVVLASIFVTFGARVDAILIFLNPLSEGSMGLPLGAVAGGLGTILWILVIANTVNFMDGANGLAIGASAIGLTALGFLILQAQPYYDPTLYTPGYICLITAASCLGFLYWNVFGGRIFAGDTGALFIGLLIGGIGASVAGLAVSVFAIVLCFLPLLADAILTVMWRMRQKANLMSAHADHVYQLAIRSGESHGKVARRYWLATLICGALANWAGPYSIFLIFLIFCVALTVGIIILQRQRAHYLALLSKQAG